MAAQLYRIAQEAVNNALKHSQARTIDIHLRRRGGNLELKVEDDGVGWVAGAGGQQRGMGLHIMDYRARSVGGAFRIAAGHRRGTVVWCRVPWQTAPAADSVPRGGE